MKKGSIITLFLITVVLATIGVLFGAVFCLRTQNVTIIGDALFDISNDEIIRSAEIKNGNPIFMINKDTAINKIESAYPYVKVIQIKTISLTEIDIRIRARHEMCYKEQNDNYYIMDEELKVLKIIKASEDGEESNKPTHLIYVENEMANINSETVEGDFVGTDYQKEVGQILYYSFVNNVKEKTPETTEYYTRADMCDIVKSIKFESKSSFDKIVITTKYGIKFDIENPSIDLTHKMNVCLSTVNSLIDEGLGREKSGTIKIYYSLEGVQQNVYIPASEESE